MLQYKRVFTGSVCSNECRHCPHKTRQNRPMSEMESDFASSFGEHGVELFGGEPTERFDFSKLVSAARALYRRVKVVTNGRALAKRETTRAAAEAGVTGFEIKLWGANAVTHDLLTGREGSFFEAIQGLSNTRSISPKPYVAIRALACEENISQLPDVARVAVSLGADRLVISPADPGLSLFAASHYFKLAIETSITNKLWAMTEGIPLCAMEGYEPHVGEALLPRAEGLSKVDACKRCAYGTVCDGVSTAVAGKFSKEARAVDENLILDGLRAIRDERQIKSLAHNL